MNPGAYLRLSPNSRVRFLDLSPDNLKLKLLQGSAIIEVLVDQLDRNPSGKDVRDKFTAYQPITVLTPDAEFVTARSGIYRSDVNSEG